MRIVDAQVHVWLPSTPGRPWPRDAAAPQREVPLEIDELLVAMDEAGVARAVLVPPAWEGPRDDYSLQAAAKWPDRFAVIGRVNPLGPGVFSALRSWAPGGGMIGMRVSLLDSGVLDALDRGELDGFFDVAQEAQVPLSLYSPALADQVHRIARRHPRLKIVVDHLGLQHRSGPADELPERVAPWLALAREENVSVKASALPCYVDEEYPFPAIQEAVRAVVGEFGAERVFWGSDLSRLPCSYRQLVDVFTNEMTFLDDRSLALVMGGAFETWFDWKMPKP